MIQYGLRWTGPRQIAPIISPIAYTGATILPLRIGTTGIELTTSFPLIAMLYFLG